MKESVNGVMKKAAKKHQRKYRRKNKSKKMINSAASASKQRSEISKGIVNQQWRLSSKAAAAA